MFMPSAVAATIETIITLVGGTYTEIEIDQTVYVDYALDDNDEIVYENTGIPLVVGQWRGPTAGAPIEYQARFLKSSGEETSPELTDTWYFCSSDPRWGVEAATYKTAFTTGTIQIRRFDSGIIMAEAALSISATNINPAL